MKKREDLVTRLYFIQRTFLQQFVLIYFPLLYKQIYYTFR